MQGSYPASVAVAPAVAPEPWDHRLARGQRNFPHLSGLNLHRAMMQQNYAARAAVAAPAPASRAVGAQSAEPPVNLLAPNAVVAAAAATAARSGLTIRRGAHWTGPRAGTGGKIVKKLLVRRNVLDLTPAQRSYLELLEISMSKGKRRGAGGPVAAAATYEYAKRRLAELPMPAGLEEHPAYKALINPAAAPAHGGAGAPSASVDLLGLDAAPEENLLKFPTREEELAGIFNAAPAAGNQGGGARKTRKARKSRKHRKSRRHSRK
jgi:hypothetical protein